MPGSGNQGNVTDIAACGISTSSRDNNAAASGSDPIHNLASRRPLNKKMSNCATMIPIVDDK